MPLIDRPVDAGNLDHLFVVHAGPHSFPRTDHDTMADLGLI